MESDLIMSSTRPWTSQRRCSHLGYIFPVPKRTFWYDLVSCLCAKLPSFPNLKYQKSRIHQRRPIHLNMRKESKISLSVHFTQTSLPPSLFSFLATSANVPDKLGSECPLLDPSTRSDVILDVDFNLRTQCFLAFANQVFELSIETTQTLILLSFLLSFQSCPPRSLLRRRTIHRPCPAWASHPRTRSSNGNSRSRKRSIR
jgi:hypothetical protein